MQSEDLKARLLKVESASPDFIGRNDGGCHTCFYRNPDGPEAADHITALEAENARLREALENAAEAMTCRDGDSAHYCPNCDNSMHGAREAVYAALQHNGDEG